MRDINYTVKNDVIFNYLFSHKEILKDFLEACLKEKLDILDVMNQFSLKRAYYDQKIGVLDIRVKVNDDKLVDIEMQRGKEKHFVKRILLYTGAFIRGQLEVGDKYEKLKNTVMISIQEHTMFEGTEDYHTVWKLKDEVHPELGNLEGLEIHFIELEKFRKANPDMHEKLNQWLALIDTEDKARVDVAMKENDKVKEAINKVDDFMSDEEAREIVRLREKWQMDYDSSIASAKEDGYEEGHEKGLKDGLAEGIEKGLAEGREEGELNAKIKIANKLLKKNSDIEEIIEITGLSETQILKLKQI